MNHNEIELPPWVDRYKVPMIAWCIMQFYGGKRINYPGWFKYNHGECPRENPNLASTWSGTHVNQETVSQRDDTWEYDYGQIVVWIIENLNGPWATLGHGCYFFADEDDAMAFKLAWE